MKLFLFTLLANAQESYCPAKQKCCPDDPINCNDTSIAEDKRQTCGYYWIGELKPEECKEKCDENDDCKAFALDDDWCYGIVNHLNSTDENADCTTLSEYIEIQKNFNFQNPEAVPYDMSSKDTEYLDADGKKITVKLNQCAHASNYVTLDAAKNPAECKAKCEEKAKESNDKCKFYATYQTGKDCYWIKELTDEKPEDGCPSWSGYWLFSVDKACSTHTKTSVCKGETPICSKNETTDPCDSTRAQECTCTKKNVEVIKPVLPTVVPTKKPKVVVKNKKTNVLPTVVPTKKPKVVVKNKKKSCADYSCKAGSRRSTNKESAECQKDKNCQEVCCTETKKQLQAKKQSPSKVNQKAGANNNGLVFLKLGVSQLALALLL